MERFAPAHRQPRDSSRSSPTGRQPRGASHGALTLHVAMMVGRPSPDLNGISYDERRLLRVAHVPVVRRRAAKTSVPVLEHESDVVQGSVRFSITSRPSLDPCGLGHCQYDLAPPLCDVTHTFCDRVRTLGENAQTQCNPPARFRSIPQPLVHHARPLHDISPTRCEDAPRSCACDPKQRASAPRLCKLPATE
jgi:hypothetical protein